MTTAPTGTDRVLADAAARGLDVQIVERAEARSIEEAAALIGVDVASLVKTLVVKRSDDRYLLVLVPGDRRIAWAPLRALVGVNRLQLPDAEQALAATGYARGTITPLGALGDWPVIADERIRGRRIALGAGAPGRSALVDGDALLASFAATVGAITEPA